MMHKGTQFTRNYVWDVATLAWVPMQQPTLESDSVTITGSVTDAEMRAYQTATGTINGNGQSVTLALNGAGAASVNFINSSFSGTVRFYVSCDGGTTYIEHQAVSGYTNEPSNRLHAGVNPERIYHFVLMGGETHVRVTSVTYSSGSVAVTIKAGPGAPNPLGFLLTSSSGGDETLPLGGVVVMAKSGNGARPFNLSNAPHELGGVNGLVVYSVAQRASAGSTVSVNDTNSSTRISTGSSSHIGRIIVNTSSAVLYLKLGETASATDFTKRLQQWETYEVPHHYCGNIDGIWATDPNDGAAITTILT